MVMSKTLALRILTIFTEGGRPTAPLVAVVRGLVSEKELDARFLIPIIAELDKVRLTDGSVGILTMSRPTS